MAEAAVGAIIQPLVDKLFTLAAEQISLVRHFKGDLEKLKDSFSMVQAFLHDAEKKKVTSSAVKVWLRELEDLSFDADNVIDDMDYELLSKQVKKPTFNKAVQKVQSCFSSCSPIPYRLEMGPRIKDINERLEKINQRARDYGLQISLTSATDRLDASGGWETDSFTKDAIFLGRESEVSEIVKKLITTEQKSSVLPIVGMGGQGKTTIAREVYDDKNIISHFGDNNRVWVSVSEIFDVLTILKKILTSITKKKSELETRQDILEELKIHFGAKKYLIVLDNVWNEDIEKWKNFVNSLSGISSANGYCMIVTTRSEDVASIVNTLSVHKLKGLPEDDCWSIIKVEAFKGENVLLDFEEIGKNIAKKCQGLPLAAKVVGGLLSRMKSKDEWSSIEKTWLLDRGDKNPISEVLKMSFDHLSSPSLKNCFACCSIFPKGYEIEKERLVELWMAEGFLQTSNNMETTGSKNFNILLRNSLLQNVRSDDYGNVTHCSMHDLVHDLACSILRENDDVTEGVCKRRYIGYKPSGDGLLSIPKGQERYVRTLFFDGKVSDIKFSDFESLHTLTLVRRDIKDLPTSIRKLKHLRYLDIFETSIVCLPDWIGELYHLQTFKYRVGCSLKKLPDSLRHLHFYAGTTLLRDSLRFLDIYAGTTLPQEMGKLTSLQTLPYFCVGNKKGFKISELGNLEDLKGELEICNLEEVRDENEAMGAGLIRKSGINKITLKWDIMRSTAVDKANDVSVLEGLQPHPNLKNLVIRGFKGKHLPRWTSKMVVQVDGRCWKGLNNLMEIQLCFCFEIEELPMLGQLPNLKSLYLGFLTNVKYIGRSFYRIDNCGNNISDNVFRALERLELQEMKYLKEWDEWDEVVVAFPCLKYLKIRGSNELMRAPSHFPCLEELIIERMESSTPLKNICGMKLTTLTHLEIKEIKGLECLPDWIFSNNHNLSNLEIYDCPKMTRLVPLILRGVGAPSLKELPDDLHSLNSLERLVIKGCPDLKSIPNYPSSFTSLRCLNIKDCKGLTNLPIEMLESCALSLEELKLNRLRSLTNVYEVIGCLHKMTRLTNLEILGVPKLDINYDGRYLKMVHLSSSDSDSDSSWNNVSFNETFDAILQPSRFNSLRTLYLSGMEDWECLPDGIQHLTSLRELTLSHFGIEALPDWFGNLSSLEILWLQDCKKLTTLPSKHAMQRLSKLKRLEIKNCPLLLKEKRCNNNYERPQIVDSEWPKISHVCVCVN